MLCLPKQKEMKDEFDALECRRHRLRRYSIQLRSFIRVPYIGTKPIPLNIKGSEIMNRQIPVTYYLLYSICLIWTILPTDTATDWKYITEKWAFSLIYRYHIRIIIRFSGTSAGRDFGTCEPTPTSEDSFDQGREGRRREKEATGGGMPCRMTRGRGRGTGVPGRVETKICWRQEQMRVAAGKNLCFFFVKNWNDFRENFHENRKFREYKNFRDIKV